MSSWSAQQSALDPWMGIVEVKPPLDAPVTDWEGNTRNDGYLYMESTMFYDVVQKDNNLVFAMNNLLDGSSSLSDFLVALNSNLNTNAGALNPEELQNSLKDASNDTNYSTVDFLGNEKYYINQAPDMMYFDNINYYYLDGNTFRVGTFVEQLGHFESIFPYGESFAKPSEMSLIGEFRINESDAASGIGWEFDAGLQFHLILLIWQHHFLSLVLKL